MIQSPESRKKIGQTVNKGKKPKSILDFSSRTTRIILRRILDERHIGCSLCDWNKDACDLHHIVQTSKGGSDKNSNLTYVCPNCHRLIHSKKIDSSSIITLETYFKSKEIDWTKYFYH